MIIKRNENAYVRKFFHYGIKDKNIGWITACVEYQIEPEKARTLALGFSFCSPKDQFSRKRGCLISAGRMEKKPILVAWDWDIKPGKKAFDYLCTALENSHYVQMLSIGFYGVVSKKSAVHMWLLEWLSAINIEVRKGEVEPIRSIPSVEELTKVLKAHSEVEEAKEWRPLAMHVHNIIVGCIAGAKK